MVKKLITSCRFKRTELHGTEVGIAIGDDWGDIDVILDKDMNVVSSPVWSYSRNENGNQIWLEIDNQIDMANARIVIEGHTP